MDEIPCVGVIARDRAGRLLLVLRANPPAAGTWSLPGGRVEPGETWEGAALRELWEETGLSGVLQGFVGEVRRDSPDGRVYVIRDYGVSCEEDALRAGDDAADAGWFTNAEVRALTTSPGLVEALDEWGVLLD